MDITVIVTKVKFNDMENKEFIERCHYVCNNWLVNELDKYLEKALASGCIDLNKVPRHYGAVYPLMAAIFEKVAYSCIYGGCNCRTVRREANNIKCFI